MGYDHIHRSSKNLRRLGWTLLLVVLYMDAEVVGGILTNSLALLADASHMLSDAGALGLCIFAIWIASRPASADRTFGYYRSEILAALINGAALVAIAVFILIEAWQRLREPQEVAGPLMLVIAVGGLVVNLVGLAILRGGRHESLNIRGAWLHVFTDTLGSLQVIAAAALISIFGWNWIDPVASALIALLVLWSSWSLLKEAVDVLLESSPSILRSKRSGKRSRRFPVSAESTISTCGPSPVASNRYRPMSSSPTSGPAFSPKSNL